MELELRQEQQLSMRQLHSLRLLQMGRLEMREYLESVAQENPTVELELQPDSLNCWGTPHGGVLFTMADVAAGMALLTLRQEVTFTVSSSIEYLSAAPGTGKLTAVGTVEKMGGHMGFSRTDIRDESGKLVAALRTVMYLTGRPLEL